MLKQFLTPIILAGGLLFVLCGSSSASAFSLGDFSPMISAPSHFIHVGDATKKKVDTAQIIGAEKFVQRVSFSAIDFLSDEDLSQSGKTKKFRALLQKHFDLKTMGKYALGRYWRMASTAEKAEYLSLFQRMVLDLYSNRFSEYSDQSIKVSGAMQKGKNILVHSKIVGKSRPDVKLDWVVKRRNGEYKVIDILVEGVSMVITQRSDFASVIQRGGGKVQVLIDHLKK